MTEQSKPTHDGFGVNVSRKLRHAEEWQHLGVRMWLRAIRLMQQGKWERAERLSAIVQLQDMQEFSPERYAYLRNTYRQ